MGLIGERENFIVGIRSILEQLIMQPQKSDSHDFWFMVFGLGGGEFPRRMSAKFLPHRSES